MPKFICLSITFMCGRFSLRVNRNEVQELPGYGADVDEWVNEDEFIPRYNIAPRSNAPVVRHRDLAPSGSRQANDNALIVQTMKWGLVPHWSKVEDKTLNTTNARSENLVEGGGMWNSIKGRKRCAIPCQGYYEWLTKGKDKLPHFTKRKDGRLLLMAGLYDSAVIEGKTLWTFTIVTTDANKEFSWLHERQPVFLSNHGQLMKWLDTSSQTWTPELTVMVQPYSDTSVPLECYAVPKEVGKVGTESPSFIEPIAGRKDGIQAMFFKQKEAQTKSPMEYPPSPAKRKREETPPRDSESATKSPRMKQENSSPSKKHLKVEDDDVVEHPNTPGSSRMKLQRHLKTPQKPKPSSPSKRTPAKKTAPHGNAKISSFFTKT